MNKKKLWLYSAFVIAVGVFQFAPARNLKSGIDIQV